ncbi:MULTISPECIES: CHAT domain-containing protein [Streptomyces]|jgi:hypothetical protein|uniref:CHAT domain-containing protein n=1 Tax=Streptomyces nymphaeiformis TaxID=2663842 RepID=A0A7W7XEZ6_9ACTN|nr:CHAT domain-containing protein [Streptomyces nymphaeiformis]MBB4985865.1 hypothetical protein [Streptomyces nymphaeiformis]
MSVDEEQGADLYRNGVHAFAKRRYGKAFHWFARAHTAGHPEAADWVYRMARIEVEPDQPPSVWESATPPVMLYAAAARAYVASTATGDGELMDRAVALNREAVRSASADHPARPLMLGSLRDVLREQYERWGRDEDLTEAIDTAYEALRVLPTGHYARLRATQGALALANTRFQTTQDPDPLHSLLDEVVRPALAQPGGPPEDRAALESSLCSSLLNLARDADEDRYLDEAVRWGRAAVDRATVGDGLFRNNLGAALTLRGRRRGSVDDLNDAVEVLFPALEDDDGKHASLAATSLMGALQTRADMIGRAADRRAAEAMRRILGDTLPAVPGEYPETLVRAAFAADRADGVDPALRALAVMPATHVDRPLLLARLAQALGSVGRRGEAVDAAREAVALAGSGRHALDANRMLGTLLLGAEDHGVLVEEDEVLKVFTTAAECCPPMHLARAEVMLGKAVGLFRRFSRHGHKADRRAAVAAMRAAAEAKGSPVQERLFAARGWAGEARASGDLDEALTGARAAVALLREYGWAGLDRADQVKSIQESKAMPRDAAALALETGQPELAVELLEQGRSVLWSSTLHLRTDLAALAAHDRDRAAELERIRTRLAGDDRLDQEERLRLARRWQRLVSEVQPLPDGTEFLGPAPFKKLAPAADAGPVVIVNISTIRCDAIIVLPGGGIEVVELPDVDVPGIDAIANTYLSHLDDAMAPDASWDTHECARHTVHDTLEWLWNRIALPVLERLDWPTESADPPRLWWCPTASLSILPLHAAGRYPRITAGPAEPVGLPYAAVSSYTTTLSALVDARRRPEPTDPALLAVALTDTGRGHTVLPGVAAELQALDRILGRPRLTVLADEAATTAAVRHRLPEHAWAHFACHGWLDMTAPAGAGLCLRDRDLSLLDLADLRLDRADLAFLSACHTRLGAGELPDEAVHTAAALRIAGFRHVVATLWSINDGAAPEVAAAFYRHLSGPDGPASTGAARALHRAVAELRAKDPTDPTVWVPFVHDGP